MSTLAWILLFAGGGSLLALTLSAGLLVLPAAAQQALVPKLIGYAAGVLLGAAFLGLLPHALDLAGSHQPLTVTLFGILGFFLLEKVVMWHHCHEEDHDPVHGRHAHQAAPLILIGDAFHNFTDGIVIAVAFAVSVPVGITSALAVIMHEIPQEVGDFAVLLEGGFSRSRAYLWNALSSLPTIPAALLTYYWLEALLPALPHLLALSAASFLYIALADLTPALHRATTRGEIATQTLLLLAGVATVYALHHTAH